MKLSVHPYFLEFYRPFALAHGTRSGTQLAFVKIDFEGIVAYGEASLPPYLLETFESVEKWVKNQYDNVRQVLTSDLIKNKAYIPFSSNHPAASAALQSAMLHWYALSKGKRLADYFETSDAVPKLSLTITKNDLNYLQEKFDRSADFTYFKLKLTGSNDDLAFVKAVRQKTDKPFCIDLNQGFQKKEDAIKLIQYLELENCVLIEQPLKADDHEGHFWLKERLAIPIIADESICQYKDLVQFHEAYSGANIKLMKCGGLFQAQKMLQFNPTSNDNSNFMKLLGCMSESTLGVATASVLASQCEMADLDSPLLNKNDPFSGFDIFNEKIELDDKIELKDTSIFT